MAPAVPDGQSEGGGEALKERVDAELADHLESLVQKSLPPLDPQRSGAPCTTR